MYNINIITIDTQLYMLLEQLGHKENIRYK